jgi:hypothetical protein
MTAVNGELGHRLTALRADFTALGSRAAGVARELAATLPPPPTLLDELNAARAAFTSLRSAVLEQAGALALVVDDQGIGSLRDLEPVLAAIAAAEEHRARLAEWEAARTEALGVLDRVMTLVHREDKVLPGLSESQRRAREMHAALSGPAPEALEHETRMLPGQTRPFVELLALVEGWNVLDDDRCAFLQDAITETFGRSLALAALRGKLGREGEAPPPPRRRAPAPAPPESATPAAARTAPAAPPPVAAPVDSAPVVAPAAPAPPVPAEAPAATAPAGPVAGSVPATPPGVATAPPAVEDAVSTTADPAGSLVGEPREAATATAGEVDGRPERAAQLEQMAAATARWWLTARGAFDALRERGLGFGDAARDYLERFPYLLGVPIQKTSEYEGGRLSEGYALLLAHVDKQEPGLVKDALARLNPQFTGDQTYSLGQELYLYVVAEGRLYKTYPDFVREVLAHAVPRPGAWVQGGIVDSDDETRLFMRAEAPGSTEEQTRTLTERNERLGPHQFRVTLGPLTTRFFTLTLDGETLADPPNVEVKLTENDAPTDHAWLITLPAGGHGKPAAPRKHRTGGTTLEELGPQFSGFWMGIFNADPRNDRHYELSIILRRKPPPIAPDHKPGAKPPADRFFGKKR